MAKGAGAPNANKLPHYRNGGPGHRGVDTSIEAAKKIAPLTGTIKNRLAEAYRLAGERGAINDEAAAVIDLEYWKARPRTTELKNAGVIKDSGRRRDSQSGVSSIVWVFVPEDERPVANDRAEATRPTDSEAA